MPKITPFLWFDGRAEEAMEFYVSVFKDDAKVLSVQRMNGKVLVVSFELLGQRFLAMNAEPLFKFNESVSFMVNCETQAEVDWYWEKLLEGGQESQCGWLKDKFGLSWQITPTALLRMMADPDPKKSGAVFQEMMKMRKIVIADLEKAYEGRAA
jgi:predicted 3-demethylubiquinone-9 3-methyltransferase (glyoxalase superfamily)